MRLPAVMFVIPVTSALCHTYNNKTLILPLVSSNNYQEIDQMIKLSIKVKFKSIILQKYMYLI